MTPSADVFTLRLLYVFPLKYNVVTGAQCDVVSGSRWRVSGFCVLVLLSQLCYREEMALYGFCVCVWGEGGGGLLQLQRCYSVRGKRWFFTVAVGVGGST